MIELLIVIVIISIVASIGTGAFKSQRQHVIYNDSLLKVINLIKTARNYTVISRSTYDECSVGNESYVPAEGYGVYISRSDQLDESRVVLFANTKADTDKEANQFDEFAAPCPDNVEEEYYLPIDTKLLGLSTDKITSIGGDSPDEAVIIFRAPLAETTLVVNDHAPSLTYLDDLYLEFTRTETEVAVSSQYVHVNRIAGFPEIER